MDWVGSRRLLGAEPLLQLLRDLAGLGEAAGLLLGEDQLVVQGDLETAAGALDEPWFEAQRFLDLVRQTGGAGMVVSDRAVLNREVRHAPSFRRRL